MDAAVAWRGAAWLSYLSILSNFVSTSISNYGCVFSGGASENLALSFSHLMLHKNTCYEGNVCASQSQSCVPSLIDNRILWKNHFCFSRIFLYNNYETSNLDMPEASCSDVEVDLSIFHGLSNRCA
jgi:hypothetical protein